VALLFELFILVVKTGWAAAKFRWEDTGLLLTNYYWGGTCYGAPL